MNLRTRALAEVAKRLTTRATARQVPARGAKQAAPRSTKKGADKVPRKSTKRNARPKSRAEIFPTSSTSAESLRSATSRTRGSTSSIGSQLGPKREQGTGMKTRRHTQLSRAMHDTVYKMYRKYISPDPKTTGRNVVGLADELL
ncbi:hypothetical protein BU25DRAFT_238635 [Macroventuria anomochaeta]|uniref:Uncharacterized protein n=1 Tax=Macroventuria anomochaeta TaxID=301207 RepID=A0ACB6RK50_9PLEO|nr:uncharacterized protein BU25DRAFT_238635 [Macroventuria anomochaeta]KAF2621352.1 hypothetical protein BU25DRAFT_238635 [Macroventuria anomochaeta]